MKNRTPNKPKSFDLDDDSKVLIGYRLRAGARVRRDGPRTKPAHQSRAKRGRK